MLQFSFRFSVQVATSHKPSASSALSHGQLRPLLRGRSLVEQCSRTSQGLQQELELDLDHYYCGANLPRKTFNYWHQLEFIFHPVDIVSSTNQGLKTRSRPPGELALDHQEKMKVAPAEVKIVSPSLNISSTTNGSRGASSPAVKVIPPVEANEEDRVGQTLFQPTDGSNTQQNSHGATRLDMAGLTNPNQTQLPEKSSISSAISETSLQNGSSLRGGWFF